MLSVRCTRMMFTLTPGDIIRLNSGKSVELIGGKEEIVLRLDDGRSIEERRLMKSHRPMSPFSKSWVTR